jgi:hypothetical protein
MVGDLRVPVPAPVGPQFPKHLEVFLKHLPERAPQALLFLIVETRSDHECNKMMTPIPSEKKLFLKPRRRVQLHKGPADHEILLHLGAISPWMAFAPCGYMGCGNQISLSGSAFTRTCHLRSMLPPR